MTCSQCHEEQTRLNKLLQKAKVDAQKLSNKTKETVIVFPTEKGFSFQVQSKYQGGVYVWKACPEP